jgi:hypothetical protein
MIDNLLLGAVAFGRNAIGVTLKPYETYRRIASHPVSWEAVYLAILLLLYIAVASLVMTTRHFATFFPSTAGGYMLSLAVFWVVGRLVGGSGKFVSVALGWGYTLLPTLLWFVTTSILYAIIPPPRSVSAAGVAFSVFYLVFSTAMLAWKVTLGYLTLRFGLKLDLPRILAVGAAALAAWSAYSLWMYRLGIFRVPFL